MRATFGAILVSAILYLFVSTFVLHSNVNDDCRCKKQDTSAVQLPVINGGVDDVERRKETMSLAFPVGDATGNDASAIARNTVDDDPCASVMSRIFRIHDCFRTHERSSCSVPGPVHNFAFYRGRGFGSVIINSVSTCRLAAALHRPCVVDLDMRDQFYILRSFINVGTYNWDPRILKPHQINISDALRKLHDEESSGWTEPVPEYDDVLPMFWHEDWKQAERHVEYWHGSNKETMHKVLLSPNWGQAWNKVKIEEDAEKSTCPANHLNTLIQNAMFAPTSLALSLHEDRRDEVIKTATYGAVHLRMIFLRAKYDSDTLTDKNLVKSLKACLEEIGQNVTKWWLVADEPDMALNVSREIDVMHTSYTAQFNKDNDHSALANRKIFGHQSMAPSIQDWMVLHESSVAVITHGTYAKTGARGNGKVSVNHCGMKGKTGQYMFEIFQKPD